mgnify:CR=1 FL=1
MRQVLSLDTWIVLSRLERTLTTPIDPSEQLQSVLARTIESFLALSGIAAEGMIRDASWAFFDAGRRVERAQETVRLLRHALGEPHARRVDTLVLDAVLGSRESLISHRRRVAERHPADTRLAIALDLLLTDASNPRALTYQLTQLVAEVGTVKTPVREALSAATTVLDGGDIVARGPMALRPRLATGLPLSRTAGAVSFGTPSAIAISRWAKSPGDIPTAF